MSEERTRSTKNREESSNIPGDEEDLALPAIINGDEVEIEHSIPTVVSRQ